MTVTLKARRTSGKSGGSRAGNSRVVPIARIDTDLGPSDIGVRPGGHRRVQPRGICPVCREEAGVLVTTGRMGSHRVGSRKQGYWPCPGFDQQPLQSSPIPGQPKVGYSMRPPKDIEALDPHTAGE